MEDELIRCDIMTFLLAGHDTTSGALNDMFQLMKPHQYSIAFSHLASAPGSASILCDV